MSAAASRSGASHQQGHPARRCSAPRPWSGSAPLSIRGSAAALRALADALVEAADLAEDYDADPDAFNQREQAKRDADR